MIEPKMTVATPEPAKSPRKAEPARKRAIESPYPAPSRRPLRIFALDPSLGASLNSYESQIATINVRNEPDLQPGPVGEYLEVVDVDPASDRFYPPVDLNDHHLLMQCGLPPSEGNPQFHQQMVYAVAMRTIESFEIGLGRKALWTFQRLSEPGKGNAFIERLRIYPHAVRQRNAYYSPERKALLFGYFPAQSSVSDLTPPGTMVFSCLSSDIVAHETTHALLDGQARAFREASNPDVRAFHEGFADIVALFQQFTYRDLVRAEIGRNRGDFSAHGLIGRLAVQFGEGSGKAGPLRDYANPNPDLTYEKTFTVHGRGSLLVRAVYAAFLAIVERRTRDLVRLATGGSGILPEGSLHPDLVERLADETIRAAQHVLKMCIRALDYTPSVDITFGEYLRAIVTADVEIFPEDANGYRVAFLEAFRRLRLLPRSLRTVSSETLSWNRVKPAACRPKWLADAIREMKIDLAANYSRARIFRLSENRRWSLHRHMLRGLTSAADWNAFGLEMGLGAYDEKGQPKPRTKRTPSTTFNVEDLRISRRQLENGEVQTQMVIVVRQRRPYFLDPAKPSTLFWFRGGSRLIIDLDNPDGNLTPSLRYVINKSIVSQSRLDRENAFRGGRPAVPLSAEEIALHEEQASLRETYFPSRRPDGGETFGAREPFALIHAEKD